MTWVTQLGWRLYSLLRLTIQPHAFFAQLYGLDWYQAMLSDWYTWLQPSTDTRILEVGCSSGGFSTTLAKLGHHVHALDSSARAIRYAQQHRDLDNLEFVTGDAMQLPWPSTQFDLTLAASLLNVLNSPQGLLEEMQRVTTDNSTVSCLFPTLDMHRESANAFIQTSGLRGFSANALKLWASAANKLAVADVEQMFRKVGLINVHHKTFLQGMVAGVRGTVK